MNASINNQVTIALNAAGAYQGAVLKIQAALKGQLTPQARETLLPYVAGFYGVALVKKERGEGMTMDINAKRFEAAKTALRRLVADVVGKTVAQAPEVVLSRAQMALIKQCHAAGITMKMFGQGVAQLTK